MNQVVNIARWEYLTRIRSRWFIISTLLIPVIMIVSMLVPTLLITSEDTESRLIAVVDGSAQYGHLFEQMITHKYELKDGRPKYQIILLQGRDYAEMKGQALELLDSSLVTACIIIPEDLSESRELRYYAKNLGNFKDQAELQITLQDLFIRQRLVDAAVSEEVIDSVTRPLNFTLMEIGKEGEEQEADELLSFLTPIIFVLMLFLSIFMSSQILLRSVIEERMNRLVEILLSSVSPTQLMAGKITGLGLLGLTQVGVYLVLGQVVSTFQGYAILTSESTLFFLVYFVLGYLFYAAIFAAIGSIFNSEHEAQQASSLFSLICILPIMLSSYVISDPNSTTSVVLGFIPFITPFIMILRIGVEMPQLWEIIASILVMAVSVVLAILAAGKIFKTAILVYGKRPTLSVIWQWLRT